MSVGSPVQPRESVRAAHSDIAFTEHSLFPYSAFHRELPSPLSLFRCSSLVSHAEHPYRPSSLRHVPEMSVEDRILLDKTKAASNRTTATAAGP